MKSSLVILMAAVLAAGTCVGCVPKENKTKVSIDPDFSEPDVIELDFTELNNMTIAGFGNVTDTPYTFISAVSIDGNNDNKQITANVEAVDGATKEDAEHFAAALLRHMNDAACDQYTTFDMSDQDSFGNLYDTYSVNVNITNEADGSELFTLDIPAGEEIELDPDIEKYEEDWKEYGNLYLKGQQDEEAQYESELAAEEAAEAEAEEGQAAETAEDEEAAEDEAETEADTESEAE